MDKKKFRLTVYSLSILIISFYTNFAFAQSGWVVQNSGTTGDLTTLYFIDENIGFAGNPSLRTTNGGTNWTLNPGLPSASDLSFINIGTGFAVNGNILKTTDGGINWANLGNDRKFLVEYVNDTMAFVAGFSSLSPLYAQVILRTSNAGISWDSVIFSMGGFSYEDYFTSLTMFDAQIGYAARYVHPDMGFIYGVVYKTTNGFDSRTTVFNRYYMKMLSICIPKLDTIFCIGDYSWVGPPQRWFIYRAINDIWTILDTSTVQLTDMFFTNASTGFVVGYGGLIRKTTNGGINWFSQPSPVTGNLNRVFFVNPNTGFIVGNSGVILKTTDGGGEPLYSISGQVRYQDNNQPVTSGYVKAVKIDNLTQRIITVDSTSIQSNGNYLLPNCPTDSLDIMAFQDDEEEKMFVPTYHVSTIYWQLSATLYPTSNLTNINIGVYRINNAGGSLNIGGGVYRSSAMDGDPYSLSDAIVYARQGSIYKGYSISNGNGSYRIDSLTSGSYELVVDRMGFYGANRIVGLSNYSKDTIDFVLNSMLVSIGAEGNNIPEHFWLSQNYPNPFNPYTKLEFGIPEALHTKLTVYDVMGRVVATLVDQELKAGNYNVQWNPSQFSSGVYFYRLEAGDYIESKRMVLIK